MVKIVIVAGLLGAVITTSDAFAWSSSKSGHGGSGGVSGEVFNGTTTNQNGSPHNVPEPSSLYAIGSALVLLGGAAWLVRRK